MPHRYSRPRAPKTYREVELVRLFVERDRPWMGILALAICTGVMGAVAVSVLAIVRMAIERFL